MQTFQGFKDDKKEFERNFKWKDTLKSHFYLDIVLFRRFKSQIRMSTVFDKTDNTHNKTIFI